MAPTSGLIRVKQHERLIASLRPPAWGQEAPSAPLAEVIHLPRLSAATSPLQHAHRVVLLDDHGRLREAGLWASLGWSAGTRVTISEMGAALVIETAADGAVALDAKGRLRIPHALRTFRSWDSGTAVLVSVPHIEPQLIVQSTSILDTLVVHHD